jgi:SAM-dependent methyltransferase
MRAVLMTTMAMLAMACGSEQALLPGDDVERLPEQTEPKTDSEAPLGALEGHICSPDGETGLAHAWVTLFTEGDGFAIKTDGDGYFQMDGLPVGTWGLVVEKGSFNVSAEVTIRADEVTQLSVDDCLPIEQNDVKIAVFSGQYDAVEEVLDVLQLDYDMVNARNGTAYISFLKDIDAMKQYDILFFNCGMDIKWRDDAAVIGQNLRKYVREGGSVYASDWSYYLIEEGWPEKNDFIGNDNKFGDATTGQDGMVTGTVLDDAMEARLGSGTASINYDLGGWVPLQDVSSDAEVLIEGRFTWKSYYGAGGGTQKGPLASRVHDQLGTVIYTSFHNEQQTTGDMAKLLEEIILSL